MNNILHSANMGHHKITFWLPNNNSDYLPVDFESLWAESLSDGVFRIDNIPFFIKRLAASALLRRGRKPDQATWTNTNL